ncbi:MAG: hypothetical protein ACP5I8_13600 [Phycisphaerae bacterium]
MPGLFNPEPASGEWLDGNHNWFATTPIVAETVGGKVTAVVSGKKAMSLQWMKVAAHHREAAGGIDAVQ